MNSFDRPIPPPAPGPRIILHIDQVVLRGFAPDEHRSILTTLQSELTRMLADPAIRAGMLQQPRLNVLRLSRLPFVPGPAGGRSLGRRIAAGIATGTVGQKGVKP